MANLTPVSSDDNVYQLETTDAALGGPGQVMNFQAQALLNKITFEKNRAKAAEDISLINTQTGTSYTLQLSDKSNTVECVNASPFTLYVPPNSSVAFDVGNTIDLLQGGVGKVTVSPGVGVTIKSLAGDLSLSGLYGGATLRQSAIDTWYLVGSLIA